MIAALNEMGVIESQETASGRSADAVVSRARVKVWAEANKMTAHAVVNKDAFVQGLNGGDVVQ